MKARNSILLRPKFGNQSRNATTFDAAYEKEERRLEARRRRRQDLEQSCLGRLLRQPDAMENQKQESARVFEMHMERVQMQKAQQDIADRAKDEEIEQVREQKLKEEEMREDARKNFMANTLKHNKQMVELKLREAKEQRITEHASDKGGFENHFNLRFGTSLV